jgi:hypothetical protein
MFKRREESVEQAKYHRYFGYISDCTEDESRRLFMSISSRPDSRNPSKAKYKYEWVLYRKKIIVRGTFETVFFNDEIKVKKAPLIFKNNFRISSFEKPFTRKAAYV